MKTIVENRSCYGCLACYDVCQKKAITISLEKGFNYPRIDEKKCVECNACKTVCPSLNHKENPEYDNFDPEVWAAWNVSDEILKDSTSGGIFIALASNFIEQGGLVCGCEFSDDYKSAHHTIVSQKTDIRKLVHSKYFQSDMANVYKAISDLLMRGEKVMFCGTPCQTAALYNFVKKNDRKNLLLVDLFCKGVPSQTVHSKFVDMLEEKEHSKITYYRSKSKAKGWGKFYTEIHYENGKKCYIRSPLDNLFVTQALNVRPACANCTYKGLDRVSDITIGDYWGVKDLSTERIKKGVSAIVINTEKGSQFVESLKNNICKEKRSVFDVSNFRNPGFSKRIVLGDDYDAFFNDVEVLPFSKVVKKYSANNSIVAIGMRKAAWIFSKVRGISIPKFIYINFLCKNIVRGKGAYIIPGPNTIFEFQKGSKLIIEKGKALINYRKPKGSKVEAWIQLNENAQMIIHNGLDIRNCRFVVQKGALLDIDDLEMNGLCNVVVREKVKIGKGVMIARDVNIYDSDYHPFALYDDIQKVDSRPVNIENHVWVGNGASIMKGVTLGEGSVVSARSVVVKSVKPKSMVSGNPAKEVAKDVFWSPGH